MLKTTCNSPNLRVDYILLKYRDLSYFDNGEDRRTLFFVVYQ